MYTAVSPPEIVAALNQEQIARIAGDTATTQVFSGGYTDASIRAAALAAYNNGGGTVKLPPATIKILSPLPVYSGIKYEGTGWLATFTGAQTSSLGGTSLVGDGTFNCFDYNSADLGTPPTVYATFVNAMVCQFCLSDLTLVNFLNGVKIGGLYNPGMNGGTFTRLNIINCTQWGLYLENYIESVFQQINVVNCTVGQIAKVASGYTALNGGNAVWTHLFTAPPSNSQTSHGICCWARGTSALNDDNSFDEQCNRSAPGATTQVATMDGVTANIGVTDSTKFPVGIPVYFSATVNGFSAGVMYFVATSAANVITVTTTYMYGTAVASTGVSAVNVSTLGFPCFEWAGLDSGSSLTAMAAYGVDAEQQASCRFLLQNCTMCTVICSFIFSTGTPHDIVTWCLRGTTFCVLQAMNPWSIDGDTQGVKAYTNVMQGLRYNQLGINFTISRCVGVGFSIFGGTTGRIKYGGGMLALYGKDVPEIALNSSTLGPDFRMPISLDPAYVANGVSLGTGDGPYHIFSTATGGTGTMPTLDTNMVGLLYPFTNPYDYIITLSTGGGQTFNNVSGATTYNVPPNSTVFFIGSQLTGSGALFWSDLNQNNVTGVLTIAQLLALTGMQPGCRMYVSDTVASAAQAYLTVIAGAGGNTVHGWATYNGTNWVWM